MKKEKVEIADATRQLESLSEDERRALRRSRFSSPASAPPPSHNTKPRLAHPGGPLATNKAVALAKFLQRKLQEPGGSASLDPDLVERAVQNAKSALHAVLMASIMAYTLLTDHLPVPWGIYFQSQTCGCMPFFSDNPL